MPRVLTFDEFEKDWWEKHKELGDTEMAQSCQFDDAPYWAWEELYGESITSVVLDN